MEHYNELYHTGVIGMKWGKRKNYSSTSIKSYITKKQNDKVDRSLDKWKEGSKNKETAIELGKKANLARMNHETNVHDKQIKKDFQTADKEYKKAIRKNTTYRKGSVKQEVGHDLARKYLSEAKKTGKLLKMDPSNSELKQKYNDLMSKHDVERANARRAQDVASNRSIKKANIKRTMTTTVKAATATAAVAGGAYAVNRYLSSHDFTLNGKSVRMSGKDINQAKKVFEFANKARQYF